MSVVTHVASKDSYTLELSRTEAEVLQLVLARIGGDPDNGARSALVGLGKNLDAVGLDFSDDQLLALGQKYNIQGWVSFGASAAFHATLYMLSALVGRECPVAGPPATPK